MHAEFLLETIREYVGLQTRLVAALIELHACDTSDRLILSWPKSGEMVVDHERWRFQRHGCGYWFRRGKQGVLIDANEVLPRADLVDPWRLWDYVTRLRGRARKRLEAISSQDVLEREFARLVEAGALVSISPWRYALPEC